MKRDLIRLSENVYDVLVIGGGIYGVCVAWDAILRGLSVALVEKGDFGHATSSNSLRIIHGGLRYLRSGDIWRARRSIREQMNFMRIAPHLVHPLPFLIPTYKHSMRGKVILSLGLLLNDLISFDLHTLSDPQKNLPRGRAITKGECIQLDPGLEDRGLTGGVIFYDCQVYSPERLILAFARSAYKAGAVLANYVEVIDFLKEGMRVSGVKVKDVLTGDVREIRTGMIINTSGPWLKRTLSHLSNHSPFDNQGLSKAFNLLVNRQITSQFALGLYSRGKINDSSSLSGKTSHYLFITPCQNRSLLGTAHLLSDDDPDHFELKEEEIQAFLDEFNAAYPAVALTLEDICFIYGGFLPTFHSRSGDVRLEPKCRIYDHGKDQGPEGLISVSGVKFTEARYVAEMVVNLVFRKLDKTPVRSTTAITPLHGGKIERFNDFLADETRREQSRFSDQIIHNLIYHYGSAYSEVLKFIDGDFESNDTSIDESSVIKAEIIHTIREEMAQKLSDVIFRRTNLGIDGYATGDSLKNIAKIMAKELDWNQERLNKEIHDATEKFSHMA